MKISEFLSENFQFLMVKFSIYLNRRVFVIKGQIRGKYENKPARQTKRVNVWNYFTPHGQFKSSSVYTCILSLQKEGTYNLVKTLYCVCCRNTMLC